MASGECINRLGRQGEYSNRGGHVLESLKSDQVIPRSRPEEQGVSSVAISAFLDDVQMKGLELHSLMLVRYGHVVAEGWWAPYEASLPHMMFSLSKSFTSTAIGLAVSEGLMTLDDAVISYFPDELPEEVVSNLAEMRIRHLLMMGTGHAEDTMETILKRADGDWASAFLSCPVEHEPGTHFVYNSGATYMLSAILQKVAGQTLLAYLQPRLFEPLGIAGASWESCPRGVNTGGWGLSIKTEDIARFGMLYLQKGVWNNQRILSEEWINEATSKRISNGDGGENDWAQGYGYQFWLCRHGVYRGDGAFGQYCIVMPEHNAVIAITSGVKDMQAVMNVVWEHLLPAMKSELLESADELAESLTVRLSELSIVQPFMQTHSLLEDSITAKTYHIDENEQDLDAFSVQFSHGDAVLAFNSKFGEQVIRLGRGTWHEGTVQISPEQEAKALSYFTWINDHTVELTVRLIDTPFGIKFECTFINDDEISLKQTTNVAFGPVELLELKGRAFQ